LNSLLKNIWNFVFKLTGVDISFSAHYYDWSFYLIELRAHYQAMKKLLTDRLLVPKVIAPGETRLQIVCCEMRKVQVAGPYNEVSIQVPVVPLDGGPSDKFVHLFLPVNTEASRWPGVDIWGFPKFIAKIDFIKNNSQIACRHVLDGQLILECRMDDKVGIKKQNKWDYYWYRKQQIIKTTMDAEGLI